MIHEVIEVPAHSERNWDDAAQQAVNEAARSMRGIKSVHAKYTEVAVEREQTNARNTFEVDE